MSNATQPKIPANCIRIPVVRASGKLERLPWGWDAETGILTLPDGLREDYLAAVEGGAEFDPKRMVAEVIREDGEDERGGLPGGGASGAKFCVHITLPVFREGEIRFQTFRQCDEWLMERGGDGEDAEGRFYGADHGEDFSKKTKNMEATQERRPDGSRTRIVFDLRDELDAEELRAFEARAAEAGKDLTDYFLSLTLRKPDQAA